MPIPLGILAVAGAGAAGGGGAFDLLETTVLGTAVNEITFSGLGSYSNYKHLQLRLVTRNTGSTDTNFAVYLFFNGSENDWNRHTLRGNGTTVSSTYTDAQNYFLIEAANPSGTSVTNSYGASIVDILDFANSSKNTTVRALNGALNAGTNNPRIQLSSGLWTNTAAVTSIGIKSILNNFAVGSRFSLYGIK